jgi:hypothetical protein
VEKEVEKRQEERREWVKVKWSVGTKEQRLFTKEIPTTVNVTAWATGGKCSKGPQERMRMEVEVQGGGLGPGEISLFFCQGDTWRT